MCKKWLAYFESIWILRSNTDPALMCVQYGCIGEVWDDIPVFSRLWGIPAAAASHLTEDTCSDRSDMKQQHYRPCLSVSGAPSLNCRGALSLASASHRLSHTCRQSIVCGLSMTPGSTTETSDLKGMFTPLLTVSDIVKCTLQFCL